MDGEKRALSWQEFVDSGFDGRDFFIAFFREKYVFILDGHRGISHSANSLVPRIPLGLNMITTIRAREYTSMG